jgi:hypothetical protein
VSHEDQVQLHSKVVHNRHKASPYFNEFLRWVKDDIGLDKDKYKVFKGMCRFPLPTNDLVESVYTEYERMFSASDAVTEITIPDATLQDDFEKYVSGLKVREYFRNEGFKAYRTQPNSLYVIDMPVMQVGSRPDPYFYRVGIAKVVDIELFRGRIEMVIFKDTDLRYIQIDAGFYRVFEKTTGQDGVETYMLISQSPHDLGYCPVTFHIHQPLYDYEDKSPVARMCPVSGSVANLDWLLFFKVGERMYETYGPFPIMTIPEQECSYVDRNSGQACDHGRVIGIRDDGTEHQYTCPSCSENSIVGAGTVFTKPIPRSKEDPELTKPVEITPPDVPSLDYITKKIDFLEWDFYEKCVGSNDKQSVKEAVNDKQVQSNAEGKRNVLFKIKRDFELTEKFIIDTIGRLRYGGLYTECNVNYGEDFLLYTEADLITQYTGVKKAGLPTYMVAEKKQRLISSSTKNNDYKRVRLDILDRLEPWTEMTLQECQQYQLDQKYPDLFLLKSDFAKFISKFELENADIVEFGSLIDYQTKIERIKTQLEKYVREQIAKAKPVLDPNSGGQGGSNPGATQASGSTVSGGSTN